MDSALIDQEFKEIKTKYLKSFNEKDKQSLYYFIQMIELLYSEISYEVYDKENLYDLVCNAFKNNTNTIFSNMKDYYLKISNSLINEFCKIVKVSILNKYISSHNLSNIYNNFKVEINENMNLDNKIKVLSKANGNLLLEQIHTNCVVNDSKKVKDIVNKYVDSITEEMIKNVNSKNELILTMYKSFTDRMTEDTLEDKEKINRLNLKVITNTTYLYLKEQEYFIIEKYINDNIDAVNSYFEKIESFENKEKSKGKLNSFKDYLFGFNNTIRVKAKNIFDEMNLVVTLEEKDLNIKMKEFNDLISHIYELDIKFDKQFANYKKKLGISSHNKDSFNKTFDKECEKLTKTIKLNISNIFRDSTTIYNEVLYKSILLKSRIGEYTEVLSENKVKDLLSK